MGHYVPTYDHCCARKEATPNSFAQYLSRACIEIIGSKNSEKLVNATASALLAASELSGSIYSRISRKSPHRRVVELLGETEVIVSYMALQEMILTSRGKITQDDWNTAVLPLIVSCVKQLSGSAVLGGSVTAFLAWPQINTSQEEETILTRSTNLVSYPNNSPQVQIRLGSIHSVKGETHTATLVLDSFYFNHHLSELKPWILGTKAGGSTVNRRGRTIFEGSRMLGRLKLHYVAMTRPTHLLCLAMRKDAFVDEELTALADRGWKIIDCCAPHHP